ncbi:MAG TPA: TetR/AcrR family transcriptional regulator [Caulobacteraceae bacterium]|jgi:AcrR family transcriptional regulator
MNSNATKTEKSGSAPRTRYHHGRLKEAMVEATVALIQEHGPEHVTVREAARRAGVSSGAPFRHFATRASLMTAAAEEAMRRFRIEIDAALADAAGEDPLVRFSALALAYLRWVVRNPTLFGILGDRRQLELDSAPGLRRDLADAHALTVDLLTQAADQGLLRSNDVFNTALTARTMAYGLGRMFVDRQLSEWGVEDSEAERTMAAAMHHYLLAIAADPDRHAFRV